MTTFVQWVSEKLHPARHHIHDAIAAIDDATAHVRSVRAQLKPYCAELDPFLAMKRGQSLTQAYSQQQDSDGPA